jgi:hypothetical protein
VTRGPSRAGSTNTMHCNEREDPDIAISYLRESRPTPTRRRPKKAGRRCLQLLGDIRDPDFCVSLIE